MPGPSELGLNPSRLFGRVDLSFTIICTVLYILPVRYDATLDTYDMISSQHSSAAGALGNTHDPNPQRPECRLRADFV